MTEPTAAAPTGGKRMLYIADPMCSWCYGFGPVIGEIAADYGDDVPVKVIVGGLRAGETTPMDARSKAYVRHHWEQVHSETGQPFAFEFFEREGFVYDTEPACRAVVTVRGAHPDAALAYFDSVQRAFYRECRDVTDGETLADIAEDAGIDRETFLARFPKPQTIDATRSDFALAMSLGVSGFPCIVLADDDGYTLLTMGYQPAARLRPALEAWLAQ